jgi:hypothetical protein
MNRSQNVANKDRNRQIRDLEIESAVLKEKMTMIRNIVGGVQVNNSPVLIDNKGFENEKGRAIATVWKVDNDIYFQSANDEDKKWLKETIEKKIKKGEGNSEEEVKKDADSFSEHLKR